MLLYIKVPALICLVNEILYHVQKQALCHIILLDSWGEMHASPTGRSHLRPNRSGQDADGERSESMFEDGQWVDACTLRSRVWKTGGTAAATFSSCPHRQGGFSWGQTHQDC